MSINNIYSNASDYNIIKERKLAWNKYSHSPIQPYILVFFLNSVDLNLNLMSKTKCCCILRIHRTHMATTQTNVQVVVASENDK